MSALAAGTLGGLLTTWVTFAPCFLWIFLGAPFVERLRGNAALSAALTAITAAVVGVILNLAVVVRPFTSCFGRWDDFTGMGLQVAVPQVASLDPLALALTALAALLAVFRFHVGPLVLLLGRGACRARTQRCRA